MQWNAMECNQVMKRNEMQMKCNEMKRDMFYIQVCMCTYVRTPLMHMQFVVYLEA